MYDSCLRMLWVFVLHIMSDMQDFKSDVDKQVFFILISTNLT